ncbi:hypothetical protein GOP47_0008918 [Adiantum capillus-veneris]|uniref:Uncharacterized protein n=1 Tax=Adiantum capillus-veneris TaxID=13818 RepID=A0A9D4ZIH0_ADICA|nr:hypothetical protein GOP47_0008918 [Adiantum capillus-veneris]
MPPSDAVVAAEKETAAEKEQVGHRNVSGHNEEEGSEASSGSMKSPVTPAALCEANGTPALRWKSYTAKQKEFDSHEKLAGASAAASDSKGKLVINLCNSSRCSGKVSPNGSEMKASISSSKKFDTSSSSQEHGSQPNQEDEGPGSQALMEIVTSESLPSGSLESVQNGVKELCTFKRPNATQDLAKMVCRRIRMVRRTLKSPTIHKSLRTRRRMHANDVRSSELDCAGVATNLNSQGPEASNLEEEAGLEGRCGSEGHLEGRRGSEGCLWNAAMEEEDVASRSEELIYTEIEERQSTGKISEACPCDGQAEYLEDKKEPSTKDVSIASAGVKEVVSAGPPCSQLMRVSCNDAECTSRDAGARDLIFGRGQARSLSHEPGTYSDTSKLDVKEQTVLETLLRDEPTGYSSGGGSEPSRSQRVEKSGCEGFIERCGHEGSSQSEDTESTDAESDCSQSDEYDEGDSASSESHECDDEECKCNGLSPGMLVSPSKGVGSAEQVPSILCDAEGNIWHIGKRAEQVRGKGMLKRLRPSNRLQDKTLGLVNKSHPVVLQELGSANMTYHTVTPYSKQIELKWKWPTDTDYTISSFGDVSNRSMVYKEKAIFVGCIPDGTENLEEILHNLMEKFLERFDFAPTILSQIQLVKVIKDFAFLELAIEKVAHIVLAANQLDVFEWGVNGFHFNIEGCKGTHTSVRPLIEYMPLKPARVIFVGNIPKSRWQREYLEGFFASILKGDDGLDDCSLVKCVYLLPESCDAYVELTSEVMADAIIFKCTKNPLFLKEIGEDVFICRDPSSVPLMSKHKGNICPQRSLYIGVSTPGAEFKIDSVRKIFEEILPMITRETNLPGYLEFISVQPGKDYAFFQFNSESFVDALMDEYVVNTHLFVCNSSPLSYIILRPPGYKRPGARYRPDRNRNEALGTMKSSIVSHPRVKNGAVLPTFRKSESIHAKQFGMFPLLPRRFGDKPAKRTDCILSIGASPLPEATWNGLSSAGACAADPNCMLIIEGLPKGLSFKLLQGALNELFEKSLSRMGLLEVGMLVLRHLDRDSNLDVVASLLSAKFVRALLSLRKILVVAGNELKLLAKSARRKGKFAEHGRGQGEVSCLSDDGAYQDEWSKGTPGNVGSISSIQRWKRAVSHIVSHVHGRKNLVSRKELEWDSEIGNTENFRGVAAFLQKNHKGAVRGALKTAKGALKVLSRRQIGSHVLKPTPLQHRRENAFKASAPHGQNATGLLKFGYRDFSAISDDRTNADDFPREILHIVSEGGKRKISSVTTAPKLVRDLGQASVLKMIGNKRKLLHLNENVSAQKTLIMQRNLKKFRQRVP